jgi:hypothetical protein
MSSIREKPEQTAGLCIPQGIAGRDAELFRLPELPGCFRSFFLFFAKTL